MKSVFTHEFKEKVVAAYLQEFKKNPNLEFRPFVRSNFPELKPKTAYNWLVLYKEAIGKKQGMSENEVSGVYGTQASAMSIKEKFMMIIETAAMNEEQIGESYISQLK